jgi:hypothetical protein
MRAGTVEPMLIPFTEQTVQTDISPGSMVRASVMQGHSE